MTDDRDSLNRREFLARLAGASALALTAAGLGVAVLDRTGPRPVENQRVLPGLGDFSRRETAGRLAMARGRDRAATLARALDALGGMEAFIDQGDRVLIKVNAAFATPAALGATTHPELLTALAERCFKAGAARVLVTDNPINNPASCFVISRSGVRVSMLAPLRKSKGYR